MTEIPEDFMVTAVESINDKDLLDAGGRRNAESLLQKKEVEVQRALAEEILSALIFDHPTLVTRLPVETHTDMHAEKTLVEASARIQRNP